MRLWFALADLREHDLLLLYRRRRQICAVDFHALKT